MAAPGPSHVPSNSPETPDSPDYMQQLDIVYTFSPEEQSFYNGLSLQTREVFRLFLIGRKRTDYGENEWDEWYQLDFDELRDEWNNNERHAFVQAHIDRGFRFLDPRLDESNFRLSNRLLAFLDNIAGEDSEDRKRFRYYVYGKTVACDRSYDDQTHEEEVLHDWENNDEAEIEKFVAIGREWSRRYRRLRYPVPPAGTMGNHLYDQNILPPPTINDIAHIAHETHQTWRFERTVHQNEHRRNRRRGIYHRIVHLFVRVDDYGQVVDRMVVKIQGELNLEGVQSAIGAEFRIQELLGRANSPHILQARAWSFRNRALAVGPRILGYIFLEWAPFGSLYDLIHTPPAVHGANQRQFPEPFLWLVFRALAEALHVMRTGLSVPHTQPTVATSTTKNASLPKAPGWKPIVNTDIKLANVVLGNPQPNRYPAYKTPKMIDFGLAFDNNKYHYGKSKELRPEFQTNPAATLYKEIGTPGCRPPEQFNPPHEKYVTSSIDARADTWNIGKIMFELLEQSSISADTSDRKFVHSDAYKNEKRYYSALPDLVQRCLHVNPSKRPQINALLYETKRGLEDWERVNTSVDRAQVEDYWNWNWKHGDDFAIGTKVPGHWRWATRRREDDDNVSDDGEPMEERWNAVPRRADDEVSSSMDEWDADEYVPEKTGNTVRKRGLESEAVDSENDQTGAAKRVRRNGGEGVRRSKREKKKKRYDWMH